MVTLETSQSFNQLEPQVLSPAGESHHTISWCLSLCQERVQPLRFTVNLQDGSMATEEEQISLFRSTNERFLLP